MKVILICLIDFWVVISNEFSRNGVNNYFAYAKEIIVQSIRKLIQDDEADGESKIT